MKPLFLSIALVGALGLGYSAAQASDYRHARGHSSGYGATVRHASHGHFQSQNVSQRGYGAGHYRQSHDSRYQGWSRHADAGRQDWRGGRAGGGDYRGNQGGYRYNGHYGGVNARQAELRERIRLASRSGALTRDERSALWAEQRAIAAEERQYRADGRLSREERTDLYKDLAQARRHIYNESRDAERSTYSPYRR